MVRSGSHRRHLIDRLEDLAKVKKYEEQQIEMFAAVMHVVAQDVPPPFGRGEDATTELVQAWEIWTMELRGLPSRMVHSQSSLRTCKRKIEEVEVELDVVQGYRRRPRQSSSGDSDETSSFPGGASSAYDGPGRRWALAASSGVGGGRSHVGGAVGGDFQPLITDFWPRRAAP